MRGRILTAAAFGLLAAVSLVFWLAGRPAPGRLSWDIQNKKTVMTFAYKAYGNPAAGEGRYSLSKTIFTNHGEGPVSDVEISYHIPEYVSWTTPEKYPEILPGQTIIDLFYPKLPAKVTELTSTTSATLEIKIAWEEEGKRLEQIVKREISFRGVNEVEYTSLPPEEIVSWFDMNDNTQLLSSFVTTDDPVVKIFAGEITRFSGGTTAGAGGGVKEVVRLMKAFYEYQVLTGFHYASSKGVPEEMGDVKSFVQNIRLPREVIMNANGLCIELAILWSTVMEHLGVRTYLVIIPGHAFTIVVSDSGEWIPVETTAISGKGLGGAATFDQAVEAGVKVWQKARESQKFILFDIQKLQTAGIRPPELKVLDAKMVQDIFDKRLEVAKQAAPRGNPQPPRQQQQAQPQQPQPGREAPPAAQPGGFVTWAHPQGFFSVSYPNSWRENGQMLQQIRQHVNWVVHISGDAATGASVEVYHFNNLADDGAAFSQMRDFIVKLGGRVDLRTNQELEVAGAKGRIYGGVTSFGEQSTSWVAAFVPTRQGVIAVSVGSDSRTYAQNQQTLVKVLESILIQ